MTGRILRNISLGIFLAICLVLSLFNSNDVAAAQPVVYKAADGFEVRSYARNWDNQAKLKSVYEELLKNTHGEEFKLLTKIIIYPGPDPQGQDAAGRWYGAWKMEKGKPRLQGSRYIELYNGNKCSEIKDVARTLAHEYGHHFTYYYYFKKENKLWSSWRTSGLALARQLKSNPMVGSSSTNHSWLIQEISAEDYVQLFGSITAKKSVDFEDLEERLPKQTTNITFTTDVFNYRPQENYQITLAANLPGLRQYWLKASGIANKRGLPPSQIDLRLEEINQIEGVNRPQYVFTWDKSNDDRTSQLEYTLVQFTLPINGADEVYPLKTVNDGEQLQAVLGSASDSNLYMWEPVPLKLAFYVVYVKDGDGLVTSSKVLAVDFTDKLSPSTVVVDDNSLLAGNWLEPRIKVRGKQLDSNVKPVILNGVLMVPLRSLTQELGAVLEWDTATRTAKVTGGDTTISMQIGSKEAVLDDRQMLLSRAPEFLSGAMMVPLNSFCEAFDVWLKWNGVLQLAEVEDL